MTVILALVQHGAMLTALQFQWEAQPVLKRFDEFKSINVVQWVSFASYTVHLSQQQDSY